MDVVHTELPNDQRGLVMTKKTTTVTPAAPAAPVFERDAEGYFVPETWGATIRHAIMADIDICLKGNTSAREVGVTFDAALLFPWVCYKGNSSAVKCGLSNTSFGLVKNVREAYKIAWNKAGLLNFDRRWQYVCQQSKHYVAPAATTPAATTAAKGKSTTKTAASAESIVNPVKKAIEQTSAIPTLVLGLKPSQCSEALRKQIAAMCGDLCELLNQIK